VQQPPEPPTSVAGLNEYLDAAEAADADARSRDVRARALVELVQQAEGAVAAALVVSPDRVLSALSEDFDAFLERLEAVVDRLAGARSADRAIELGVTDAWSELRLLREEYDSLRAAQAVAMSADPDRMHAAKSARFYDDPLCSDLAIRNLDAIFENWRGNLPERVIHVSAQEPDPRPWPINDPVAQLLWLVTSDAQPWLPTGRQLYKLAASRRERRNGKFKPKPESTVLNKYPATKYPTIKPIGAI
jgi:hypothetical protein